MRRALLYPVLIALVSWLVKAAFIVLIPLRQLVMTPWLIDDSFIFMRIARNLAQGLGYTYDGVSPTSGAPLLWTVLTTPFHLFLGPEAAAKATIILGALLAAASTVLVFYLAYRLFNSAVAWTAFALSLFLAPIFLNAANGMATSAFTFLGLLTLCIYVSGKGKSGIRKNTWYFLIGALLGLLNLTRSDGIFLAFAIIIVEAFHIFKAERSDKNLLAGKLGLLVLGIILFTLPSVIWSLYANGTPLPANQQGRQHLAWEVLLGGASDGLGAAYLKAVAGNVIRLFSLISVEMGSAILAIVAMIYLLISRRNAVFGTIAGIYSVTYFAALVFYQGYFPDVHGLRYLSLPGHIMAIAIAYLLCEVFKSTDGKGLLRPVVLAVVVVTLIISSAYQYQSLIRDLTWTRGMNIIPFYSKDQVRWFWSLLDGINLNLSDGAVVAAKDHARLAYFTNVRVVDLAGIIDPEVTAKLAAGEIGSYLQGKGVQYVLLPENGGAGIHHAVRRAVRLEKIPGAPPQECTGYLLYRIVY